MSQNFALILIIINGRNTIKGLNKLMIIGVKSSKEDNLG